MVLTKDDINVILKTLDDVENMWGLEPEEEELKEKLVKEWYKNVSE